MGWLIYLGAFFGGALVVSVVMLRGRWGESWFWAKLFGLAIALTVVVAFAFLAVVGLAPPNNDAESDPSCECPRFEVAATSVAWFDEEPLSVSRAISIGSRARIRLAYPPPTPAELRRLADGLAGFDPDDELVDVELGSITWTSPSQQSVKALWGGGREDMSITVTVPMEDALAGTDLLSEYIEVLGTVSDPKP